MAQEIQISATRSKPARQPFAWKLWVSFAVFMLVMIAGTFGVYWFYNLQTYHLAPVQVGVLYRDGNRDLREFKHALTLTQSKTVVSLIDNDELNDLNKPQFVQEIAYCVANGIQYIRIPVKLGGWPSGDDLKTFIGIVSTPANQPVLVHCAQGVRRTGMFVAAYQESVLHQSPDQASAKIKTFGHKDRDLDDVRTFINDYDPVAQTIPVKQRESTAE